MKTMDVDATDLGTGHMGAFPSYLIALAEGPMPNWCKSKGADSALYLTWEQACVKVLHIDT